MLLALFLKLYNCKQVTKLVKKFDNNEIAKTAILHQKLSVVSLNAVARTKMAIRDSVGTYFKLLRYINWFTGFYSQYYNLCMCFFVSYFALGNSFSWIA